MNRISVIVILLVLFQSCSGGSSSSEYDEEYTEDYVSEEGYADGTYCAEVTYYNPNTGTTSDYTLSVEVVDNMVIQINFENGGWMDNDHMTPEELDENGQCTIINERNYEYTVQITGEGC
jgi:hypothetical protein